MASVKITINNICAVRTRNQSKMQPRGEGHDIFLSYQFAQLPLSEHKFVTMLSSCFVERVMCQI